MAYKRISQREAMRMRRELKSAKDTLRDMRIGGGKFIAQCDATDGVLSAISTAHILEYTITVWRDGSNLRFRAIKL